MIDGLKPYPRMKDSGVPWLGEVPEHWEVVSLRHRYSVELGKMLDAAKITGSHLVPYLRNTDVQWDRINCDGLPRMDIRRDEYDRYTVRRGDLLVCEGGEVGRAAIWCDALELCGYQKALHRLRPLRPARDQSRFLFYVLFSSAQAGILRADGSESTIAHLTAERFRRYRFAFPPLVEQSGIIRFLDYADKRIRRFVRAKQKLVKLLDEQKQAIVNRIVTRGLDPNIRLKHSGAKWLGEVPDHWEVVRSKRVFAPRTELARPNDIQLSATQAYGVIPQEEYEKRIGRKVVKILRHLEKRRHVEVGDFVISMRSFQGGLERAWAAGCIRSSYIVLRPATQVEIGYFGYLFKSRAYIKALQSTANFIRDGQDLNFENFCAIDLPFPPIEEQRQIGQMLDDAVADIVKAAERAQAEIDLLKEYRTRLVADVVTGKLDVREAATNLLDDLNTEDVLDEPDALADDEGETGDAYDEATMEAEA